jgi:hypothetical protein
MFRQSILFFGGTAMASLRDLFPSHGKPTCKIHIDKDRQVAVVSALDGSDTVEVPLVDLQKVVVEALAYEAEKGPAALPGVTIDLTETERENFGAMAAAAGITLEELLRLMQRAGANRERN